MQLIPKGIWFIFEGSDGREFHQVCRNSIDSSVYAYNIHNGHEYGLYRFDRKNIQILSELEKEVWLCLEESVQK